MSDDEMPSTIEIEANLDYVKERGIAISLLIDSMHAFEDAGIQKFEINTDLFYALLSHLSNILLSNETERVVCEAELARARYFEIIKNPL